MQRSISWQANRSPNRLRAALVRQHELGTCFPVRGFFLTIAHPQYARKPLDTADYTQVISAKPLLINLDGFFVNRFGDFAPFFLGVGFGNVFKSFGKYEIFLI